MSARTLWLASRRIGEILAASRDSAALREAIDFEAASGQARPPVAMVRHILAGFNPLHTRPMLLGLYLPRIPSMGPIPGYDELTRIEGGTQFIEAAARLASALLLIVEHLRARLPGYPGFPVPDLCPGSPAVVNDGFFAFERLPWPAAARRLQTGEAADLSVGLALDVDSTELQANLSEMLEALRAHESWCEFIRVSSELGDLELELLGSICAEFAQRTAEPVVDQRAGPLLMQRAQYARAVLEEVRSRASGLAADYLAAFARVDHMIDLAAAVISERVAYRAPVSLPSDAEVSWHRVDGTLQARALVPADPLPFLHPGRLIIYRAKPPAGGAWFLRGTSHTINFELGSQSTLTGEGLEDSAGVFDDLVQPESDHESH